MNTLVPLWIPTLICGIGAAIMIVFMVLEWRERDKVYKRGYDAGTADTIRSRITINAVRIGPASSEMRFTEWIEIEDDDKAVH